MSVTAGVTAVKASLELAKILSDRLNRPDVDVADVRSKVHEMLIHMVNAQVALGEAQVEISDLRRELDDRGARKSLEADVEFRTDGGFWVRKSEADKALIRYCPACWGKDAKLVAMAPYSKPGVYRCPLHEKAVYATSEYHEWLGRQPAEPRGAAVGRPWIDLNRQF